MRLFIGFTGVKQAGKTTAFNFLKEKYPTIREIPLAGRLKDTCAKVFDIPRNWFDDQDKKEAELEHPIYLNTERIEDLITTFGFTPQFDAHVRPHIGQVLDTPRRIAQYVGTDILRAVDSNVHCKGAMMDLPQDGVFVVTDMRFPDEYSFFQDNYGDAFYPFYIANLRAEANAKGDPHPSERYILEIAKKCVTIDNNGSLESLNNAIIQYFNEILNTNGDAGVQAYTQPAVGAA